ncbi:tetratricopeptide (TPR) repeat protein [Salirhabdus euzebyi]|uniref:Tetratricopeptide (TPR) repeat protein n=1 Tax=Salirhabdus euzebyi TaxID=394506 RepID=A0A841Q563_9BACI|nr:hypothetical protein [Salirhabdus euzebyi]MBB6453546.1 tetratricopeptide (TPR) repeat protein [Salirhabdus euzebyi]
MNELENKVRMSVKEKKQVLEGEVKRIALFFRSKIVEIDAGGESFYLVYYKDVFVHGEKLRNFKEHSFIQNSFQTGIVFESPHPMLSNLIPKNSVAIQHKNKLFEKLHSQYSLQEITYIAITLHDFFEKEELDTVISDIFFHYRRSGNLLKSYQILLLLHEFAPHLKIANESLRSLEYKNYHKYYHSSDLLAIHKKDPFYVELQCFSNRFISENREILQNILREKENSIALLILWIESCEKAVMQETVDQYNSVALKIFTLEQWINILNKLRMNPFQAMPEAKSFIKVLTQKQEYEKAAMMILPHQHELPNSYKPFVSDIWSNVSSSFLVSHIEKCIQVIPHVFEQNEKSLEQLLHRLVVQMLQESEVEEVQEKLLPLKKKMVKSLVLNKVDKMVKMSQDLDSMMELGNYFEEFQQYDKAIECFSWEMELFPDDPKPVWKMIKMYQQKGMTDQVQAFQKIYSQLSKTS